MKEGRFINIGYKGKSRYQVKQLRHFMENCGIIFHESKFYKVFKIADTKGLRRALFKHTRDNGFTYTYTYKYTD